MDAPQNEKKKNDDRQRNADQKKEGAPFHGFPPKRETRAPFKAEAAPAAAVRKDKTVRLGTAPKRGKFLPARSAWVARLIIRYFDVGQTEKTRKWTFFLPVGNSFKFSKRFRGSRISQKFCEGVQDFVKIALDQTDRRP